jgi:hypothetical protein
LQSHKTTMLLVGMLALGYGMAFITVSGVAFGPFAAGVVSDDRGLGGHGVSLALSKVCVCSAFVGAAAVLFARPGGSRVVMECAK